MKWLLFLFFGTTAKSETNQTPSKSATRFNVKFLKMLCYWLIEEHVCSCKTTSARVSLWVQWSKLAAHMWCIPVYTIYLIEILKSLIETTIDCSVFAFKVFVHDFSCGNKALLAERVGFKTIITVLDNSNVYFRQSQRLVCVFVCMAYNSCTTHHHVAIYWW